MTLAAHDRTTTSPIRGERVLLAVDGSRSAERAVAFVAAWGREHPHVEVVVRHVLPPLPPALLETRGAELPREEERIEERMRVRQRRALEERERRAAGVLARVQRKLETAGVRRIDASTVAAEQRGLADQLYEIARTERCATIVVGRSSASWLKELVQRHVGDELLKDAEDVNVCVVGEGGVRGKSKRR